MTTIAPGVGGSGMVVEPTSIGSENNEHGLIKDQDLNEAKAKRDGEPNEPKSNVPPDEEPKHHYKRRGRPDKPMATGKPKEPKPPKPPKSSKPSKPSESAPKPKPPKA